MNNWVAVQSPQPIDAYVLIDNTMWSMMLPEYHNVYKNKKPSESKNLCSA